MLHPPFSYPQAGIGDERSKRVSTQLQWIDTERKKRTENRVVLTILEDLVIILLQPFFRHSRSSPRDFNIEAGDISNWNFRR